VLAASLALWAKRLAAEHALVHALLSLQMNDKQEREPTQQTQPKKGKPIEIPVPKRGDVMDFLEKTAKLPDPDRSDSATSTEK
jgi:hypothetical protein